MIDNYFQSQSVQVKNHSILRVKTSNLIKLCEDIISFVEDYRKKSINEFIKKYKRSIKVSGFLWWTQYRCETDEEFIDSLKYDWFLDHQYEELLNKYNTVFRLAKNILILCENEDEVEITSDKFNQLISF